MLFSFLKKSSIALVFLFCHFAKVQEVKPAQNIVSEIKVIGNKTTKEHIILRELPFKVGDTISADELSEVIERARSNLFITQLFNFVTIETAYFHDTFLSFYITVEERWYWWPLPIFEIQETNFNT